MIGEERKNPKIQSDKSEKIASEENLISFEIYENEALGKQGLNAGKKTEERKMFLYFIGK